MTRLITLIGVVTISGGLGAAAPQTTVLTAAEQKEGFKVLFDGKGTAGWTPRWAPAPGTPPTQPPPVGDAASRETAKWQVENSEIVSVRDSGRGHLVSNQAYGDFVLRLEFWVDAAANSGVFIRAPESGPVGANNAYEVNIFDPHAEWPTGSINILQRTSGTPKTVGKWNTYEITAQGDHLVVVLNGEKTVDARSSLHRRGPFGLQYNGVGMVKFRNIRIKEL